MHSEIHVVASGLTSEAPSTVPLSMPTNSVAPSTVPSSEAATSGVASTSIPTNEFVEGSACDEMAMTLLAPSSPAVSLMAPSEPLFPSPKKVDNTNDPLYQALREVFYDPERPALTGLQGSIFEARKQNSDERLVTIRESAAHTSGTSSSGVSKPAPQPLQPTSTRIPSDTLPDPRFLRNFDGKEATSELGKTLQSFRELAQKMPAAYQMREVVSDVNFDTIFEWLTFPSGSRIGQTTRKWKLPGRGDWEFDPHPAMDHTRVPDSVLPSTAQEL